MSNDKRRDSYEIRFGRNESSELLKEVTEMEANSEWISEVDGSKLSLIALLGSSEAESEANRYGLDYDLTVDTIRGGSGLVMDTPWGYTLLRDIAKQDIVEIAKLSGSALRRMTTELFAQTINNGLSVSQGTAMVLMRFGKAAAIHSDGDGGYDVMPISELLCITEEVLNRRFSGGDFMQGINSHGYTSALWQLPAIQSRMRTAYANALGQVGSLYNTWTFTPAVLFASSDTASSAASLIPVFTLPNGIEVRFVSGVRVKHTKRGKRVGNDRKSAVDVFRKEAETLFSRFEECEEVISKLNAVTINHGCNAVVSVCKKIGIPKRYGEAARSEMERLTCGDRSVTAHDL